MSRNELTSAASRHISRAEIEGLALRLLEEPQVDCPVKHEFARGIYYREFTVPPGTFVIGRCHREESFSVLLEGKATVLMGNEVKRLEAPMVLSCCMGLNKVAIVHEKMVWGSFHANPSDIRDVDILEEVLLEPVMTQAEINAALLEFGPRLGLKKLVEVAKGEA